ncbi:MAG: hypothetical protein ACT4O0_05330 [Pseudonocardia sp.]
MDSMMRSVWVACLEVLQAVFGLVDSFSTFTITTGGQAAPTAPGGPSVVALGSLWPTLLWLSGVIAFGLFLWQLSISAARGGRGMWHAATGPFAYGIALAITVAGVVAVLELADGLTTAILSAGLRADNFTATWTHVPFSSAQALDGVKAVVLGLAGLFGVLPVALGYAIEIIWRQAAILVLVATIPISAAGLLAQATASWYWRTLRWTLAAIAMKPLLALTVVLGVSTLAGQSGVVGLLAGIGVLAVSLLCPFALFRLFAFVDPNTQAGAGLREAFSGIASRATTGIGGLLEPAGDSGGAGGQSAGGFGGVGAMETANTSRFDAAGGTSTGPMGTTGGSSTAPAGAGWSEATPPPPSSASATGATADQGPRGSTYGGATGPGEDPPPEPPPPDPGPGGQPRPPGGGGPRGGPRGGGGGRAASAAEIEEAAAIL